MIHHSNLTIKEPDELILTRIASTNNVKQILTNYLLGWCVLDLPPNELCKGTVKQCRIQWIQHIVCETDDELSELVQRIMRGGNE